MTWRSNMLRRSRHPKGHRRERCLDTPPLPGWYTDTRNHKAMLWWDGLRWKDVGRPSPPPAFNWLLHFLLFLVAMAVLYVGISFVVGLFALPFALRAAGRRARDLLMLLIPLWGTVVLIQTVWRITDRRISWLPRPDLPSRPLFGPAILPKNVLPEDVRAAMQTGYARFEGPVRRQMDN
jgi:hypothetical protein